MLKEEIFALLDQLLIDQTKYNKFLDYVHTFTKEPRCKKGCLAFIEEIFNLPNVAGKEILALTLASTKLNVTLLKHVASLKITILQMVITMHLRKHVC